MSKQNDPSSIIGISGEGLPQSKIESFSGHHTDSLIVGILFVVCLICFTIYVSTNKEVNNTIITVFSSLLSGLIGYFSGSVIKRR